MTQEEIGEIFGVTKERINQIECRALRKMRKRTEHLQEHIASEHKFLTQEPFLHD